MADTRSLEPAHFDGASLQQMHGWVTGGSGAGPLHDNSALWAKEQQYMRDLANRVRDALTKANAIMQSQSGEALQNAVAPVALWTEVAAENALVQSQRLQEQGEAFSKVQAAVPNPSELKPVPEDNWVQQGWAALTGGKTDNQIATAQNEKLRQDAITAFNAYQGTTQTSVAGTPAFTAPPPTTVDASMQSNPQASVGQPSSSFSRNTSGGGSPSGSAGTFSGGSGASTPGSTHGSPLPGGGSSVDPGTAGGTHSAGAAPAPVAPPSATQAPTTGSQPGGGSGFGGMIGGFGEAGGSAGGSSGGGARGGAGRGAVEGGGRAGSGGSGKAAASESAAGGRGSSSSQSAGAAGGGRGGHGEESEEDEHYSPEFLKADHGFFDDNIPAVAPPVLGE
jgi:hypothetical protein